MKVAISIPDRVFKAADRLARELKKSRSQLYAEAAKLPETSVSEKEIPGFQSERRQRLAADER